MGITQLDALKKYCKGTIELSIVKRHKDKKDEKLFLRYIVDDLEEFDLSKVVIKWKNLTLVLLLSPMFIVNFK